MCGIYIYRFWTMDMSNKSYLCLKLRFLADSDAGAYRCAIVNPFGKGNANFNLKLTGA